MNTKEPFFVDDVTKKTRLACTPANLKIPLSNDTQLTKFEVLPRAQLPTRRPSMEPYYQLRPSTVLSSLSSYAQLSDIFDYHYLPLSEFVAGLSDENAIMSDSDTEPEDDEEFEKTQMERVRFRRFTAESVTRDADNEDKLHFMTFKHNSRNAGVPAKVDHSIISDHFCEVEQSPRIDVMAVPRHVPIAAPRFVSKSVEPLDTPSSVQLVEYLAKCSNPLSSERDARMEATLAPSGVSKTIHWKANDTYEGVSRQQFFMDDSKNVSDFLI